MCFHEASARLRDLGCPKAFELMDRAEPSVLCYLDFPAAHAKRIRTDNVQFRPASLNAHPWRSAA